MTPEQFWHQDSTLVIAYRKAEELRQRKQDCDAWLQGLYVYHAIGALVPVLRAFGSGKAEPYLEAPLLEPKEHAQRRKVLAQRDKMIEWAKNWNADFNEREQDKELNE